MWYDTEPNKRNGHFFPSWNSQLTKHIHGSVVIFQDGLEVELIFLFLEKCEYTNKVSNINLLKRNFWVGEKWRKNQNVTELTIAGRWQGNGHFVIFACGQIGFWNVYIILCLCMWPEYSNQWSYMMPNVHAKHTLQSQMTNHALQFNLSSWNIQQQPTIVT